MRDSRSANGRIPDPFARDEIDSPRVTDRVYGRHRPRELLAKLLDHFAEPDRGCEAVIQIPNDATIVVIGGNNSVSLRQRLFGERR